MKVNLSTSSSNNNFMIKIIVIVAVIFLIDLAYGQITYNLYDKGFAKHIPAQVLRDLIEKKPEIVILGASRANHHYDPRLIEKQTRMTTYNSGFDGTNSCYTRDVLKIITKNYIPKIVIVDVSPGLNFQTDKNLYSRHNNLSILNRYLDGFPREIYRYNKFENYLHIFNFYKMNSIFPSLLKASLSKDVKSIYDGYRPLSGYDKILDEPNDIGFDTNNYNKELYQANQEIVKICKDRNILLLFTTSPMYVNNINIIPKDFIRFLEKVDVPYLNFPLANYSVLNKKKYFKDLGHMNKNGADLFTNIFCKDLITLLNKKDNNEK